MIDGATLAWVILAFAAFYAAEPQRRPPHLRERVAPSTALRVAGTLLLALSVALRSEVEAPTAALLVVLAMFCAVATLFVLLAPVAPRCCWSLALACAPTGLVLSALGVFHG